MDVDGTEHRRRGKAGTKGGGCLELPLGKLSLLKVGRSGLDWSELISLASSLGSSQRDSPPAKVR